MEKLTTDDLSQTSAIDTFADGTRSVMSVLRPRGAGWREVPCPDLGQDQPKRAFVHSETGLFALSALEVTDERNGGDRLEYHVSFSIGGRKRCTSNAAKWALRQFGMQGAEEDNHVPGGVVRNFWRPVAHDLVGSVCPCKAEEPAIVEDRGDFVWRPTK